jgi:hypothetical protein
VENEIGETFSMRSLPTKAHTFASRIPQIAGQKSVLFGNPKRNSIFFSLPSVFYFFATHNRHQNSWTETAKTLTDSDITLTEDRRPACNSTYKKLAVQWLNEALCFVSSFVVAESLALRNRQLLVAAKRYTTFWNEFKIDKYYEKDKTENNLSEFPEFISILH